MENDCRRYVVIGHGQKNMVMLPGLALSSTLPASRSVAAAYRIFENYTIYLCDDRCDLKEGYSIRNRAERVAADLMECGVKEAYVFGASMGGMVGQYLAGMYPQLVKKLVVTSTSPCLSAHDTDVIGKWRNLAAEGKMKELITTLTRDIYSSDTIAKYGAILEMGVDSITEKDRRDFIVLCDAILAADTFAELDKIKCPVLSVGAKGDRVFGTEGPETIANRLGCELYLYGEQYGHAVYDEAEDHKERILEFFERD